MRFEWDQAKAVINEAKHGVTFEYAARVFLDPWSMDEKDDATEEARWITMGLVEEFVLLVVWVERAERIRLISARKADRRERERYWNGRV